MCSWQVTPLLATECEVASPQVCGTPALRVNPVCPKGAAKINTEMDLSHGTGAAGDFFTECCVIPTRRTRLKVRSAKIATESAGDLPVLHQTSVYLQFQPVMGRFLRSGSPDHNKARRRLPLCGDLRVLLGPSRSCFLPPLLILLFPPGLGWPGSDPPARAAAARCSAAVAPRAHQGPRRRSLSDARERPQPQCRPGSREQWHPIRAARF